MCERFLSGNNQARPTSLDSPLVFLFVVKPLIVARVPLPSCRCHDSTSSGDWHRAKDLAARCFRHSVDIVQLRSRTRE